MTSTSTVATEGKAPMLLAVIWTLTVLATACVVVRLCVRKHMQNFGLDDWMIGASMVQSFLLQWTPEAVWIIADLV